jgi:hypothetical protein
VIWIGDACSVHVKKKSKDDPYDSTRMMGKKKELVKGGLKKLVGDGTRMISSRVCF